MIAQLKQGFPNMAVTGPTDTDALVLKGSDGNSYSLPTASFAYSDSKGGAAAAIYSVSQLTDKSHAVAATICGNATTDTRTLMTRASSMEATAATIQVKVP
jgi:hypothetical protein